MNAGNYFKLVKDLIALIDSKNLFTADGSFDASRLNSFSEDVTFAVEVENLLKANGIVVPDNIDQIIKLLPLIAGLAG